MFSWDTVRYVRVYYDINIVHCDIYMGRCEFYTGVPAQEQSVLYCLDQCSQPS